MTQITQPAFPIMPIQDNFKRLIVPVPGINKLEHFALEFYKVYKQNLDENNMAELDQEEYNEADGIPRNINEFVMDNAINDAITFLNLLEEKTKTLNNEKSNEVPIFNS